MATAWATAALQRAKRLPPLKRLIRPDQAPEEARAELEKARADHEALMSEVAGYDNRGGLLVPRER